jgi:hypothetical protein
MPVYLPQGLSLEAQGPSPEDLREAIWNMASEYVGEHHRLPTFLYMNQQDFDDVETGLTHTLMELDLVPVTSHEIPPGRVSLLHEYVPVATVARHHADRKEEDLSYF